MATEQQQEEGEELATEKQQQVTRSRTAPLRHNLLLVSGKRLDGIHTRHAADHLCSLEEYLFFSSYGSGPPLASSFQMEVGWSRCFARYLKDSRPTVPSF